MMRGVVMARRRLLVALEVSGKDPAYPWVLEWISHHSAKQISQPSSGLFSRLASRPHNLAVATAYEKRQDGSSSTSFSLIPGTGSHYFKYGPAWFQASSFFWLLAKRERSSTQLDITTGKPWETILLTTLSRDRNLLPKLLEEARILAYSSLVGKLVIYTAWGVDWKPFGNPRTRRMLESVILDNGVKENIVEDVRKFMERETWYRKRGIPYRRGYLLHGPPGSGKTCFIEALAGHFEYNICILNVSERGLTDDKLNHLLSRVPERTFVIFEDVDAAFTGRTQSGTPTSVTFSGLLNVLDGLASSASQRLLFMTTNHPEVLDPALIRPGRIDVQLHLGHATKHQAGTLFKRFYEGAEGISPAELDRIREEIERRVDEQEVSMAELQGHFIRNAPKEALEHWGDLMRSHLEGEERKKIQFASSPS
ncbi:hypothetical protein BT69DRAFT_1245029 [Atractiella rhizophila]|nr:hypothetical protein BT69DRAFT_1245029 [Atractiella rhizophila]